MKFFWILLVALVVVFTAAICECNADEFNFAWDYGDTAVDGFRIYSGPMMQREDGTWYPQLAADPLIDSIPADSREATGTEKGWPGQSKKLCFVSRAYRGDEESADSNYVCAVINNEPLLSPADLAGSYDHDIEQIEISWSQPDFERAKFFQIYYKIGDENFQLLEKVDNIGQQELRLTKAFDAVPDGQSADVSFVIVAYKNFDVFSPNSAELTITIDRTQDAPIPPPDNFRLSVTIGVQ